MNIFPSAGRVLVKNRLTATEDYLLGAMGGSADCCVLYLEVLWEQPAAISRHAHSTQQVVFSKPFEPHEL
jgi:hypothetical protein